MNQDQSNQKEMENIRLLLRSEFRDWLNWAARDTRAEIKVRIEVLRYIQGLIHAAIRTGDLGAFIEWAGSAREQLFFTRLPSRYKTGFVNHHFLRMYEFQIGSKLETHGKAFYSNYFQQLFLITKSTLDDQDLESDLKINLLAQQTTIMNRFLRRIGHSTAHGIAKYAIYTQISREAAVLFYLRTKRTDEALNYYNAVLTKDLQPTQLSAQEFHQDDAQETFSWHFWQFNEFDVEASYVIRPFLDLTLWAVSRDIINHTTEWLQWLPISHLEALPHEALCSLAK